jgi:hypothetical protein
MLDISFEIDGRKVSPNSVSDALEAAILRSVSASIKDRVGNIKCPDHGQTPKIVGKGRSLNTLSFDVSGCCQKLIDSVVTKLK